MKKEQKKGPKLGSHMQNKLKLNFLNLKFEKVAVDQQQIDCMSQYLVYRHSMMTQATLSYAKKN